MTEDRKSTGKRGVEGAASGAKERRRMGLFAWLGPMLERRLPHVEQVDEEEFKEPVGKKK